MSTNENGAGAAPPKRKLIEVALPLEAINRESAREKEPFTRNHPRSIHIWWARRPLVTARAVLFAQLVDDPSSSPDRFPTEAKQRAERRRLHRLIERLAVWENSQDDELLAEAYREVLESTGGNPPPIHDPFAGGATIPLEAQRLGLSARASDLNPVAVLINKALIEMPPRFLGRPPAFPGLAETRLGDWSGTAGLAADVRAYGDWVHAEAQRRIGHHYPGARDGRAGDGVISWIWARTVTCPNPACGISAPLVRSWWLSRKRGREAWITPILASDPASPGRATVQFEVRQGQGGPSSDRDGTVTRNGATCVACGAAISLKHVRQEGVARRISTRLMAIVLSGERRKIYLSPDAAHSRAADLPKPPGAPEASLPTQAPSFRVQAYGMECWADLFSNRQLLALTTFSDLVAEVREQVRDHAVAAGMTQSERYEAGGAGADAYADVVATLLGLAVSRYADMSNSLCSWNQTNENVRALFARQAIPMAWDFAEANPFGQIGLRGPIESVAKALNVAPRATGSVQQCPAQNADFAGALLSTDPPYYDNIGYSDLSDFFYVWLRRALRGIHPQLLSTMLVPKSEELVANPYRHDGRAGAKQFFEDGFRTVFERARQAALPDFPITVYYAFKQSDVGDDGDASTGWETLLASMLQSGWAITATWPMRSERSGRMLSVGTNALASSIVLALRPRPHDAQTTDRRGFIRALRDELPGALRSLQQGAIAPVDLPQAAIGPGMAIFSRYSQVIEDDGDPMTVRAALARINEMLDQVLNEQEGDFDPWTRFAIAWYRQHGYQTGRYGDADNLARARGTAVDAMVRAGILKSAAGRVTLLAPRELPEDYDVVADERVGAWEVLHHLIRRLDKFGAPAAGEFVDAVGRRQDGAVDLELVKELTFLLFAVAEKSGWTADAVAFNTVATAWPDIVAAARTARGATGEQAEFEF